MARDPGGPSPAADRLHNVSTTQVDSSGLRRTPGDSIDGNNILAANWLGSEVMRQHQVSDLLPQGFGSRRLHTGHASGVPASKEAGFSIPFGDLGSRRLQFIVSLCVTLAVSVVSTISTELNTRCRPSPPPAPQDQPPRHQSDRGSPRRSLGHQERRPLRPRGVHFRSESSPTPAPPGRTALPRTRHRSRLLSSSDRPRSTRRPPGVASGGADRGLEESDGRGLVGTQRQSGHLP